MIEISKLNIYRNFRPLNIVNVLENGQPSIRYKVMSGAKETVGTFCLNDAYINNLSIESKFRHTKTSAYALISIYEFVKKYAIEKGITNLFFFGYNNNPNHVVRMYEKVANPLPVGNITYFTLPIEINQQKIIEKIKKFTDEIMKNIVGIN